MLFPDSPKNILDPLPEPAPDGTEIFEELLRRPGCRLERIVSHGQVSPEGFWYDQNEDEWILIVHGEATISFEQPTWEVTLTIGGSLLIPAHRRHRVVSTASPTVWLALWLTPL